MVTLLTSSPEPELEEHYAEDSMDSTYEDQEEDEDLPDGSGWVKKALPPGKGKGGRARRGVSLGVGKRTGQAADGKAARARRKTSAKF